MEYPSDRVGKILTQTLKLLDDQIAQDPAKLLQIAWEAQVPLPWLKAVVDRRTVNPGVNRIEHLYEYLTGQSITI